MSNVSWLAENMKHTHTHKHAAHKSHDCQISAVKYLRVLFTALPFIWDSGTL